MKEKRMLTESDVMKIVYASTKKALKEAFFHRTYREGNPQSAKDVITGNGWGGRLVKKDANEMVFRVFTNSDAVLSNGDDSLSFEDLVDDLNIYYEKKGVHAEGVYEYNGEKGTFIIVRR